MYYILYTCVVLSRVTDQLSYVSVQVVAGLDPDTVISQSSVVMAGKCVFDVC